MKLADGTALCVGCDSSDVLGGRHRSGCYELATCRRCSLRWIVNPPYGEELAALYSSGFYEPGPNRANRIIEAGHAFNNAFRMRELRGSWPGRLLDIGSGRGRFLSVAVSAGWKAIGIEFEPGLAEMARRRYGVQVVVGDAIGAELDGPFDVITMWHVLEHLPDPLASLERSRASWLPVDDSWCPCRTTTVGKLILGATTGCTLTSLATSSTSLPDL